MTAASALLVATAALAALAVGAALGVWYSRRASTHRNASEVAQTGLTVSQMLERIVAISPTGIVVVDKHQDVVLVNARARELGLVRDRQLDEQAWNAAQRTLATGEAVEVDLTTKPRAPGRAGFSLRGHVRRLSDADTRWVVIYVDDDSEHVRMEATRRDFVANVSHELKTPVGAMGVLAEALLESSDDPATVRHFGEQVLAESRRLGNMVTELIALSRLQGAEKLPDLEVVDVDFVVSEALSRSKVAAENADIAVTTDAPSGFEVRGDPTLLITAISNLVANAIAYSPQGSPVSISRRRRGDKVEIAVTDRGIGIAKEHQERVFERFFRVDKARSRDTGGTGLGLAIVKHVAANHNGVIKLWSQPGTGSTFTLSLPVYEDDVDDDDAEDTQADSPTGDTTPRKDATNHPPRPHGLPASGSSKADGLLASTPPADGLRSSHRLIPSTAQPLTRRAQSDYTRGTCTSMTSVLIVEDEDSLADPLAFLLRKEGFEATIVNDGPSALAEFERAGADIVLLDLMLPGMSGTDVCKQLRAKSSVPVIMVTARDSEIDKVVGLELGADDYVTKPYSARELIARIRAVLRRGSDSEETASGDGVLEAGPVRMDVDRHTVSVNGEAITLPLKEFDLLEYLIRNSGRVLTRGQLIDRVWGADYVGDTKTLDVHVKRLRSKIEADPANPVHLVTVRGLGYKLEG